ncbi:MAG: PQQ-dependent sugar dehydrogenase [Phycisphaerales bacterium]|nr:PQQ-dependent sugar dehydrogenase [Phycisphaerales bacterium]
MFRFAITAAAAACIAGLGTTATGADLTTQRLVTGLARPVFVCAAPGDSDRIFIVEQRSGSTGRIRVFNRTTNTLLSTPFLSMTVSTGSEQGLLGMAFHPDYANNGYFFVNYTNSSGTTVIARYTVSSSNPNVASAGSATTVMTISQPYTNHNGGCIQFGPDGYLWIGTGDGGSGGDPGNRAQDITNQLLGKMLRIDVDSLPYTIPADNPFVSTTGDDEIYSYGWRNPWRFSFDSLTGDFYSADVGQNAWEEVDVVGGSDGIGGNFGWRCYEGDHAYNTSGCPSSSTMIFPVHEYAQGGSPYRCSITGGVVYRGSEIPDLQGTYFFGDYCSNQIWSFVWDGGGGINNLQDRTSELAPDIGSIGSISSFGEDADGNIYICDLGGEVFVIQADAPSGACCVGTSCVTIPEANCNAGGGDYQGDFVACTSELCYPAPANDDCNTATLISSGTSTYSTDYSTDSANSDCGIVRDVWMSYTADCNGIMLITIQGDFFDEVSAVYEGCPTGTGDSLACDEGSYIIPCSNGTQYLIRVGGADADETGSGSISINCIPSITCDGDCDGDGEVNVDDILMMLAQFGTAGDCDTNGDGIIDVNDLLAQIGNWGPC